MNEIEIRGKMSKRDFNRLTRLITKRGQLPDHYYRLSVDISPGFNPQTRMWNNPTQTDLRIKKSNQMEKISLKIGDYHKKEREEIDIDLEEGQFLNAVKLFEALGFNEGMVYFWQSWEFKRQGFEIKLSKLGENYFIWEIESRKNYAEPNLLAKDLKLTPFTKKEYKEEIRWQNRHLHQLYSYNLVEKMLKSPFFRQKTSILKEKPIKRPSNQNNQSHKNC